MPLIQLSLFFNERNGLKSVSFDYNNTGLPTDSELLKQVALTLLKAIAKNKDSVVVQDLLNELGIERTKD